MKKENPTRILLLEDNLNFLETLTDLLTDQGYAVTAVSRSDEAIRLASQQDFDLLITDIRMEGLDGLQALEKVKQDQPAIQGMVMSGYCDDHESARAERLGVHEILSKPFRAEAFLTAVERLTVGLKAQKSKLDSERSLVAALLWSVGLATRSSMIAAGHEHAYQAVEQVGQIWQKLGNSVASAEQLQLASLLYYAEESGAEVVPDSVMACLPAAVDKTFKGLQRQVDSLEFAVCRASESLALEQPLPEMPASYQEQIQFALSSSEQRAPEEQQRAAKLLAVGRALEAVGDHEAADMAYRDVVSLVSGREKAEALLGRGRLAKDQGNPKDALALAQEAYRESNNLSPLVRVSVSLATGLLLEAIKALPAKEILSRGLDFASKLELKLYAAVFTLALRAIEPTAPSDPARSDQFPAWVAPDQVYVELLNGIHSEELRSHDWWLFPALLTQARLKPQDEQLKKLVSRWIAEGQRRLLTLLQQGRIGVEERRILTLFPLPEELLGRLENDLDESVRLEARKKLHAEAPVSTLKVYLLGQFRVTIGDYEIPDSVWRNQRARFLLGYLACRGYQPLSEELLIEELWPEEARGKHNLYSLRSFLRKALRLPSENEGVESAIEHILKSSSGLQMNPDIPLWCDVTEFERILDEVPAAERQGRPTVALALFREAISLWKGNFMDNCYLNWAETYRQRLMRRLTESLTRYGQLAFQQELTEEVLIAAEKLRSVDPYRDEGYSLAMQAMLKMKKYSDIIQLYEKSVSVYRKAFQSEPPIEFLELYHRAKLSL